MNTQTLSYQSQTDEKELNVYYFENTFWLTLNNMTELFNCSASNIYSALKDVQKNDNLNQMLVNQHLEVKSISGNNSIGNFYNLDIIMAIGYRLNPKEATEFRLWSLFMIKNYILQRAKLEYGIVGSLKKSFTKMLAS
jgi:hypothetical protein